MVVVINVINPLVPLKKNDGVKILNFSIQFSVLWLFLYIGGLEFVKVLMKSIWTYLKQEKNILYWQSLKLLSLKLAYRLQGCMTIMNSSSKESAFNILRYCDMVLNIYNLEKV